MLLLYQNFGRFFIIIIRNCVITCPFMANFTSLSPSTNYTAKIIIIFRDVWTRISIFAHARCGDKDSSRPAMRRARAPGALGAEA